MGRFPRVRLREGYHAADVDEFIDQVEATLAGRPDGQPVTAEQADQQPPDERSGQADHQQLGPVDRLAARQ